MDEQFVVDYILSSFPGVETTTSAGYIFFFYGTDRLLPFTTLAVRDNEFDHVSGLDRPGVYRLNIGISRETYRSLLGPEKPHLGAGEGEHDFAQLDRLMPHPFYAPQSWVCILSPGRTTFDEVVQPLLSEAYERAVARTQRRGEDQPFGSETPDR